ncbi:MAG: hypothetical protein IID45_10010, partial [Planctomycetes bacterium]|nr:hypothetical protein [Planctomycetota bacterium]
MPKQKRGPLWVATAVVAVVLISLQTEVHRASCPQEIEVSRETTFFTEPVDQDGEVDYVAAINRHYGRGVTPENNAAVPMFR